jgi:death on curing protein
VSLFLTKCEVLALYGEQIALFGGTHGLRDEGLLEAALFRPQTGYYADLIEEAAALWESLSQNHAYVDGNKRVALASTDTFLRINGRRIAARPAAIIAFLDERYATGTMKFDALVAWLRANSEPL